MFSILPATASVLSEAEKHTTDDSGIQIEAKFKKVTSYKITFNGNGGKIGTKTKVTKSINKGAKIKKFPATPKRTGYTFQGWYTKKSGGKKVNVNFKPTKSVTLYTHWKKISSRVLTAEEKKLVGTWGDKWNGNHRYTFYSDGTFIELTRFDSYDYGKKGNYSLKNGILTRKFYSSKNFARPFGNNYGKGWGSWTYETSKEEGYRGVIFSTIDGKPAFTFGLWRMNDEWFIKDGVLPFTLDAYPKDYKVGQ
ncbi:MAG: InlB B-repeat-containing protein [Methanobrevibacter sp.]|nr:InlB B-repeat-containing protein [Methanobrevibacter sp.]